MKKQTVFLIVTVVLVGCSYVQANPADINNDGRVNFLDIAILAQNWLWTVQPDGMVWVEINEPGGPDKEGFVGQMSKYEITNDQYCQFLNAALDSVDLIVTEHLSSGTYSVKGAVGHNAGEDFPGEHYYDLNGPGYEGKGQSRINFVDGKFIVDRMFTNHPVNYVTWYGAQAFCNYYLYRLPTEQEWRAVADFDGSFTYGCGTVIGILLANYIDSYHIYGTTAVGNYGAFGYGMCDMAGNAWEWTHTFSDVSSPPYYEDLVVICGGGWPDTAGWCAISVGIDWYPDISASHIGFRVCR